MSTSTSDHDDELRDDPLPPSHNGGPPRQATPPPPAEPAGPQRPNPFARGLTPEPPAADSFGFAGNTTAFRPADTGRPAGPAATPPPIVVPPQAAAPAPAPVSVPPEAADQAGPNRPMSEPAPLPIPGAGGRGAVNDATVRIGLWGSTRSGKSTFLAALPIAAMQGRHGTWVVAGTDELATDYLNQSVNRLVVQRRFPTPNRVIEPISWSFHGTPPPSGWGKSLFSSMRRQPPGPVEFRLELHDPPGSHFEDGRISEVSIENLANASGLIYLINPVLERRDIEMNFRNFFGALQRLTSRMAASGQMVNGKLPHFVAVCVTKFDDVNLFRHLVSTTDLVAQDSAGARLPRVNQDRSAEYFDWVCDRLLGGNTTMVRDALRAYFHEDRINYFATSAIGFRLNNSNVFDYRDFRNTESIDGAVGLREIPRPINVLEPLIFLERRIRAARR